MRTIALALALACLPAAVPSEAKGPARVVKPGPGKVEVERGWHKKGPDKCKERYDMGFRRHELSGVLNRVLNPTRLPGVGILLDEWIDGVTATARVQMPGDPNWLAAHCNGSYSLPVGASVYVYEYPDGSYSFEFPADPGASVPPTLLDNYYYLVDEWIPGTSTFITLRHEFTAEEIEARPTPAFELVPLPVMTPVRVYTYGGVLNVYELVPIGEDPVDPDPIEVPALDSMTLPGVVDAGNLHDFGDGRGLIAALRHRNPDGTTGGWVEDSPNVRVDKTVTMRDDAEAFGHAQLYGHPTVSGTAKVYGNAKVHGHAVVGGNAWVSGDADVGDDANVSGRCWVQGTVEGLGIVRGDAQVLGGTVTTGGVAEGNVRWLSGILDYELSGNARMD